MKETKIKLFQDAKKAGMFVVGQRNKAVFNAFLNMAHEVMHPESAFSPLIRELLGAYVSKQFGCSFCHLGHLETAFALGGEEVRTLVDNPSDELKPVYAFSDKVISNTVTETDLEIFLNLDYTEKHYEDIVFVCALFGFANRMVTGFGVEYNPKRDKTSSRYLAKGYKMPSIFVVSDNADWSVVQQGMQKETSKARRYHWNSDNIKSFVEEPHTAIRRDFQGEIINLVDKQAKPTQSSILNITIENPEKMLEEVKKITMPTYKDIKAKDVDLKRLGRILWLAQETETQNFEDLLLLKCLDPRTLQSKALVSEVIHGTASRFSEPARFTFAHAGKGGRPFPVPTKVYDQTIETLKNSVEKAKIGDNDKQNAIKKLTELAQKSEENFTPNNNFEALIKKENDEAWKYEDKTINGFQNRITIKTAHNSV